MRVETILNRVYPLKDFVYGASRLEESTVLIPVRARRGSRPSCSVCGATASTYDTKPSRRFAFVPLWNLKVSFEYRERRVDCPDCGVRVERLPWAKPYARLCSVFSQFLSTWAKRLSISGVARAFSVNWSTVYEAVEEMVEWGLEHRDLTGIEAIGIDELAVQKRHRYGTLVYQIDAGKERLLHISEERTEASIRSFFDWFGGERTKALKFVCSDLWPPYLKLVKERAGKAIHVLDRFHVMSHLSKAIDQVRADEARKLNAQGISLLKNTRFLLLKRSLLLKPDQQARLRDLVRYNLRSVRAWILKEDFNAFWSYLSPHFAARFLKVWTTRAMRSRLEPMKRVARMLRRHEPYLLNYIRARWTISSGKVEAMNGNARVLTRGAYGFRSFQVIKTLLFHRLGKLPEPPLTHSFA